MWNHFSKMRILYFIFLLFCGCSHNPVTGKSELALVTESQEIAAGEEYYSYMQQAEGGLYLADPLVEKYVQKVGFKLAEVSDRPHLPYEFVVLNNSTPNAWALPGGKIAINRGLLVELKSEAELAAVLAHEIVHSAARHGAKGMERQLLIDMGLAGLGQALKGHQYEDLVMGSAQVGGGLISLKYSRAAELEADEHGIKYMVRAGYDPQAAVELQKTFLRLSQEQRTTWLGGLFASHPPSQERIDANEKTASQYPRGGYLGIQEYEIQLEHLIQTKPAYEALDNGYVALIEKKDPIEALRLAQEGIALEPKEAHLYNLAGKANKALGKTSNAISDFEKATQLNPHYFDFPLQLGLVEQKLGRAVTTRTSPLIPKAKNLLDVQGRWNRNKNLVLTVRNTSTSPLHNIILEITLYDPTAKPLLQRKIALSEVLEPGQKSRVVTEITQPPHASWMETAIKQAKIYR